MTDCPEPAPDTFAPTNWPDTSSPLWHQGVALLRAELQEHGQQMCCNSQQRICQRVSIVTLIGRFIPVPLCRAHFHRAHSRRAQAG